MNIETNEAPKCQCGRSPNGYCIGWHALSEEEYQIEKEKYDTIESEHE